MGIFPFILMCWFGNCQKKSKKSSFWPSSMGVYSTLLWPCSKSGRFLFQGPNHPLNAAKSHPNPPRTKQDLKNIDFSLLDLQNSLIGSLFRWFFQIYKIAYKSRLDQTWFLALNHPLNAAKSPPNPPRTKQDLKNIDFSLLDLKNSLTGSLFRCFFQIYKITYKYHINNLEKTPKKAPSQWIFEI